MIHTRYNNIGYRVVLRHLRHQHGQKKSPLAAVFCFICSIVTSVTGFRENLGFVQALGSLKVINQETAEIKKTKTHANMHTAARPT